MTCAFETTICLSLLYIAMNFDIANAITRTIFPLTLFLDIYSVNKFFFSFFTFNFFFFILGCIQIIVAISDLTLKIYIASESDG